MTWTTFPSSVLSILAFAAVAALLVLTPGVGTTFLMSTVISRGRRAGYLAALGMVAGAALHATIAAFGTAVLIRRFPAALTWVAILGGGFIFILGLRGIVRAIRPNISGPGSTVPDSRGHTFITTGFLIALSNAPLPLFYFVVVPDYVPRGMSRLGGAALLSGIHLAMAGTWMATFVTLVGKLVDVLRRPRVLLGLQLAAGVLLVFLGSRAVAGAI